MSTFVGDPRSYVVKRPRIDLIASDLQDQMHLLAEIVDGGLEDDKLAPGDPGTLTQDFPFPNGPPVADPKSTASAEQSPGLGLLIEAVGGAFAGMSQGEKNSMRKVVRNVTGTFETCFSSWTVRVGVEGQLSELRRVVGLSPMTTSYGRATLDYTSLVRPSVITETYTNREYPHSEDFFFRSVHLGTECWAFIALSRLDAATTALRKHGHWHNAAASVLSAAHIVEYLGRHITMLTSMVLRDYLKLKVEIEGTSGEGSSAVKKLRPTIEALLPPLMQTLAVTSPDLNTPPKELLQGLYEAPEKQPGLYAYAKALEAAESALLGGFYYRHFMLASNVIGTNAKGTMHKAVAALKKSYETPVFPTLDLVRSDLGRKMDRELVHNKGRIMDVIEKEHIRKISLGFSSDTLVSDGEAFYDPSGEGQSSASGCPFGHGGGSPPAPPGRGISPLGSSGSLASSSGSIADAEDRSFEGIRAHLYSERDVPSVLSQAYASEMNGRNKRISFLDHAWGKTPPAAHVAATKRQYALYQVGNSAWDVIFGDVMPESADHIRWILNARKDATIEFGHNSHELISRLLSIKMEKLVRGDPGAKLRVLTTDTEFYSFTRQMNRLMGVGGDRVDVQCVPIEPLPTFESRFVDRVRRQPASDPLDFVYVSQCVYSTQQTIVRDLASFEKSVGDLLGPCGPSAPFFVLDGYHGFGAIPTDASTFDRALYVSGTLKHVAAGANCAFLVVPPGTGELRPLLTGWLADPTVLAAESEGIKLGSEVGYLQGYSCMGGTPAFAPSLLIFNEVIRRWKERGITVKDVHGHVMSLHRRFISGIQGMVGRHGGGSCWGDMCRLNEEGVRSHTIVFKMSSPAVAKCVVSLLDRLDMEVDSRKFYVRIGFGFNHSAEDVDLLLSKCEQTQAHMAMKISSESE